MSVAEKSVGAPVDRIEGREKVEGSAKYAAEYEREGVAYAHVVQSTVAAGRVRGIDAAEALSLPGVLAVLTHDNAPRVDAEGELAVLQSPEVSYRGQIVGVAIAESPEIARQAGLTPDTKEFTDYHVHAHLDVFVDGQPVEVPGGGGIEITDPAVNPTV